MTPPTFDSSGVKLTDALIPRWTDIWVASADWYDVANAFKIFRDADRIDETAHLEFSYGLSGSGRFRWAFTSIGAAFADENAKVTPSGSSAGIGDCNTVACPQNDLKCSDGDRYWRNYHVSLAFKGYVAGAHLLTSIRSATPNQTWSWNYVKKRPAS